MLCDKIDFYDEVKIFSDNITICVNVNMTECNVGYFTSKKTVKLSEIKFNVIFVPVF